MATVFPANNENLIELCKAIKNVFVYAEYLIWLPPFGSEECINGSSTNKDLCNQNLSDNSDSDEEIHVTAPVVKKEKDELLTSLYLMKNLSSKIESVASKQKSKEENKIPTPVQPQTKAPENKMNFLDYSDSDEEFKEKMKSIKKIKLNNEKDPSRSNKPSDYLRSIIASNETVYSDIEDEDNSDVHIENFIEISNVKKINKQEKQTNQPAFRFQEADLHFELNFENGEKEDESLDIFKKYHMVNGVVTSINQRSTIEKNDCCQIF